LGVGCDKPSSTMKGQTNAAVTFYGLAVDQNGGALQGVRVSYQVESFPEDWTFEKRGEPLSATTVSSTSDSRGRFEFAVNAHILRRTNVEAPPGYRHFFEKYEGTVAGETIRSTYGYLITSWGDRCFRADPANPAVFVFVKNEAREVSAPPCRGGYDSGNGTNWSQNKPAWPKKPSLEDVAYKPPTTAPTSQP
jgi:hypothetical protein